MIKFAVLRYYSGTIDVDIAPESLNVGILFVDLLNNTQKFIMTTNFKRVESFDDELRMNMFKATLKSIKIEIEQMRDFNIESYIKKFVNSYRFSDIIASKNTDYDNFILMTKQMFLKYDFEKSKRLASEIKVRYMKTLIKESEVDFSNGAVVGRYGENLNFDMRFDNSVVKIFAFKDKNINRMISTVKSWVFNSIDLKKTKQIDTIFVYDADINNDTFNIIKSIFLENNCKYFTLLEFKEYLEKHIKEKNDLNMYEQVKFKEVK